MMKKALTIYIGILGSIMILLGYLSHQPLAMRVVIALVGLVMVIASTVAEYLMNYKPKVTQS